MPSRSVVMLSPALTELTNTNNGETSDFLETAFTLCMRGVAAANQIPSDRRYDILRTAATRQVDSVAESVLHNLFRLLRATVPQELEIYPAITSAAVFAHSFDRFINCTNALKAAANEGISHADKEGRAAPMGPYLAQKLLPGPRVLTGDEALLSNAEQQQGRAEDYWYTDYRACPIPGRFVPGLPRKHNAATPLSEAFLLALKQREIWAAERVEALKEVKPPVCPVAVASLKRYYETVKTMPPLPHPYEAEIDSLDWSDSSRPEGNLGLLERAKIDRVQQSIMDTPLKSIQNDRELERFIKRCRRKEIKHLAIDVEHSDRNYRGITCLIQISTLTEDWIIYPENIKHDLWKLNEITTDPHVLKILHGCNSDIIWLQRDFGVYFVNVFDTVRAARELQTPGGAGLRNLLQFYCGVKVSKAFQLADWTCRPLTEEMINYARCDTHFLFQLFEQLKCELLSDSAPDAEITEVAVTKRGRIRMLQVLRESAEICGQVYTETPLPNFVEMGENIQRRRPVTLLPAGTECLYRLLEWRDLIARLLDLRSSAVLLTQQMQAISSALPTTLTELKLVTRPPPPSKYNDQILKIVRDAIKFVNQETDQQMELLHHDNLLTPSDTNRENFIAEYTHARQKLAPVVINAKVKSKARKRSFDRILSRVVQAGPLEVAVSFRQEMIKRLRRDDVVISTLKTA